MQQKQVLIATDQLIENQSTHAASALLTLPPHRLSAMVARAAAWGGRVAAALCPPVDPTPFTFLEKALRYV